MASPSLHGDLHDLPPSNRPLVWRAALLESIQPRQSRSVDGMLEVCGEKDWLCSLPAKVRRAYCSPREGSFPQRLAQVPPQLPLTGLESSQSRPLGSLTMQTRTRSAPSRTFLDTSSLCASETDSEDEDADDLEERMPHFIIHDDQSSQQTVDEYHRYIAASANNQTNAKSRGPFQQALSMGDSGGLSSPRPSTSSFTWSSAFPQRSSRAPSKRAMSAPSSPLNTPQYYQDPEARTRLKIYLASDEKFDEMLEHGFPSQQPVNCDRQSKRRATLAPALPRSSSDACTHCRPSNLTFLDVDEEEDFDQTDHDEDELDEDEKGLDDDEESIIDTSSPTTPRDTQTFYNPKSPLAPVRRSMPASRQQKAPSNLAPIFTGNPAKREMTFRMTLTKLELRAHSEQLYVWQQSPSSETDPLMIRALPPGADFRYETPAALEYGCQTSRTVRRLIKKMKTTTNRMG